MVHEKLTFPETRSSASSRRQALAVMLGAWPLLRRALAAPDSAAPVRFAISESLVSDVNLNDARAAMQIWLGRMTIELGVGIELAPKVFESTDEILRRARGGQLDAVALNIIEYRQIAGMLDSSEIITEATVRGLDQYILLAKGSSAIRHLGDLRGRRLCTLRSPKMCVAPAWLSTILDEGHFGPSDQFFGSSITATKVSQVVLPVFFGKVDACLTSKRGFDAMCELNPQIAKELTIIASSPAMVTTFYLFHKNYHGAYREKFAKVYSNIASSSAAGHQLATLFQFENMVVKDFACLAPALAILDLAEHVRSKSGAGTEGARE